MADIVSSEKRSLMMSGIKGKNTRPEMIIRSALHKLGMRFRLHDRKLPGKPDLVFPKYNAVIFIHGCFWHGHDCHLFKWPSSRNEFWQSKILRNNTLDKISEDKLFQTGWRVGVIWECSLKGKTKQDFSKLILSCLDWLKSSEIKFEARGL